MYKKTLYFFFLTNLFLITHSCKKELKIPAEILAINAPVNIDRFDQAFNQLNEKSLDSLQEKYPFLFPIKYSQEFWLHKSKDTLQQELKNEVYKVFPNTQELEEDLTLLYKHLKFYYPTIKVPKIISIISEIDYKNRILLRKELLLISLDSYLGKDHYFYGDISKYISNDFEKNQILIDVAQEYAKKIFPRPDGRDFMSQMILYGKRQYLLQQLLPKRNLAQVFSYTKEELKWNQVNESEIWRYLIEKDLLYSTDRNLLPRFLYPAPFSKFYMSYDTQSPDRVGQYIGYRIVNSFMQNNNVSLPSLKEIDSKTIFTQSRFKPKK